MKQYQLLVIGSGPGGYTAAIRAAQLGLKTAIVESGLIGGTCLNRGCMPTKAMLHSTGLYAECGHFDKLGLSVTGLAYDMEQIYMRKNEVVETLRRGVEQLLKANGVNVIAGVGVITGPEAVSVNGTIYTTDNILAATGSVPARPPIPGLALEGVVTSDDILEGPAVDYKTLIIIGGGVIGVEMASIYSNLGCNVTVIEAMDRLLPDMDREISQSLAMILKKRGVKIFTSARVEEILRAEDGKQLACRFICKDKEQTAAAVGILVSTGRRPNTNGLFAPGLEPESDRGFITVDDRYATSIKGVYAIGDVIGGVQLAHKAEAEGIAAVEMLCGHPPLTDPRLVPSCVYTNPEIACVGMTADEATKAGRSVKASKYLMSGNGRSIIDLQERGFVKAVFDSETDTLLGIQLMCARATDLISEFTGAILNGATRSALLKGMRPHPSFCEGITEALEAVDNRSIHSLPRK